MEIADKLRELRKAKGLTQEEMAAALFVTRQSVYKWETGKALPDLEKLTLICRLFDVSADELLELAPREKQQATVETADAPPCDSEKPVEQAPPQAARRKKLLLPMLCVLLLLVVGVLVAPSAAIPTELRNAQTDGMIPSDWVSLNADEISERDFLALLNQTAALRLNAESPALRAALAASANERLTREKAAYWLYCAHIWTVVEPVAALHFDGDVTEVSSRDQWQDMNALGRAFADSLTPPWEQQLCTELAQVGVLFDRYDGTAAMDTEINAILDGRCYSSVAFCLTQRSFVSELPLMETQNDSFRPKAHITAREAVVAARRLYEAW